jgi:DME family drug/metabolite transporter
MIGIVLALLSAVGSGLSVVLVRKNSDLSNSFNISLILSCVGMLVLWPAAISVWGTESLSLSSFLFFGISGLLSPGIVRLLYYQGMTKLGASINSSIYTAYPVYSTLLAVILISEVLSVWNALGIIVVLTGIILANFSTNSTSGKRKASWKSLIFPIVAGITFGVASVIRKYALGLSNTPIIGVAIAYTFSLLPFLLMLTSSNTVRGGLALKQSVRWFWAAGIGQAITWILAFYALSFEQVSIVAPLLSTEPLFVIAFAFVFLKKLELISTKLIVSSFLTILGVILVTFR